MESELYQYFENNKLTPDFTDKRIIEINNIIKKNWPYLNYNVSSTQKQIIQTLSNKKA